MCYVTVVLWDGLDRGGDICSRSEGCVGVRRVDMGPKELFFFWKKRLADQRFQGRSMPRVLRRTERRPWT